jgi:hypothetical protein
MTFSPMYITVAIALGVAIDWAFYERSLNVMRQFLDLRKPYAYIATLFPRAIGIIASPVIILYGVVLPSDRLTYIVLGTSLFLLSNFYGYFWIYFDNKRNQM